MSLQLKKLSSGPRAELSWNFLTIHRARYRVGIGLSYRTARLHKQAESVPWIGFLGSLKVYKFGLRVLEQKEERWGR
jgi:hypothetical protein